MATQLELHGLIASAGFSSGDRIVCGHWFDGPLGPMSDVMWATPDNRRILLAPNQPVADLVSAIYRFDEIRVTDVEVRVIDEGRVFEVDAAPLRMRIEGGIRIPIPFGKLRTPNFTRYVENPIARITMGLKTYGSTPTGMEEWYRVDGLRRASHAEAWRHGVSLGASTAIDPPLNMGVSDPPKAGSIVEVRPLVRDRTGALQSMGL